MAKNPFTLSFSRKPVEYIDRPVQTNRILETFREDPITDQLFLIMGVRGSGKTVLLSSVANILEQDTRWTVIRCAPTGSIVHEIAQELSSAGHGSISVTAQIHLPVGQIGLSSETIKGTDQTQIDRVLDTFQKQGRKLLITVDEVTNTPQMREFASVFQILVGKERPIFFLGTGLYENILPLQNENNMTFLYRAPRINLTPLDMAAIARSYAKLPGVSAGQSVQLAALTKGYPFAFQALGYLLWEHLPDCSFQTILPDYDTVLADSAYSKMWMEMSDRDREVCRSIANSAGNRTKDIRSLCGMDSSLFSVYRARLRNRGIINTMEYGKVAFALPRFAEFVRDRAILYEI